MILCQSTAPIVASIFYSDTYRIESDLECVVFCRDGLEFHPASNKPDSEERAECNFDLQATTQQTSCTSVLVQKQPPIYSHWPCDSTAQWRSRLLQACLFHLCSTLSVPFMKCFKQHLLAVFRSPTVEATSAGHQMSTLNDSLPQGERLWWYKVWQLSGRTAPLPVQA